MWLAGLLAIAGLEHDFEELRRLYAPHISATPESLWTMYIPTLEVGDHSGTFVQQMVGIARENGWKKNVEEHLCSNNLYVGPQAAATRQLLKYSEGKWTNGSLLMGGVGGEVLVAADVAAVAKDRHTNLCEISTCPLGHACRRVGALPAVCLNKEDSLWDDAILLVAMLLLSITTLIYLVWISEQTR